MAFYDTGEYFNSSVDNWLDYYDISFYEDSSETLSEMYMSTPSGGVMSIVFDGGSFKKGNYENNIKELERQIYKYCQNDLDDICEPYIEHFSRDKSWFADCGITSYRELIDDIEEWKNTLIDFDNRLLGEIKNLEKDYSKELNTEAQQKDNEIKAEMIYYDEHMSAEEFFENEELVDEYVRWLNRSIYRENERVSLDDEIGHARAASGEFNHSAKTTHEKAKERD